eukprot:CAMPEP_0119558438 /NCGR_PEP_ID=MMETSP1352-20130426/10784_1 /TAXON_ID=265584 /ORGANISM="Stauroneis constricta, Strain CCMP1120" /LENGTH=523 /DNA_ID=CAMNT_0007605807 /DNA_START=387 /DNA_END=1958 /DNA_ORIENTATION=+
MSTLPLDELSAHANSYSSANGIQVERRNEETSSSYFVAAPMSLLPNAYPKQAFDKAQTLAAPFNQLVDRISRDPQFLMDTLGGGVSDADPYTAKLLQLYKEIYTGDSPNAFAASADRLGIQRSDYMLNKSHGDENPYELKQVELNTIAASFAGLAVNIAGLHRYLTQRFEGDIGEFLDVNRKIVTDASTSTTSSLSSAPGVPENPALTRIPAAMKVAFDRYSDRFGTSSDKLCILFVVQEGETNTVDQRMLEFGLWNDHKIPVIRKSLTRLATELNVDDSTGAMSVDGKEVAVVYFRAGYAPTDYPDGYDGIEWDARSRLEKSRAAKCPSLGYHLAGTKKVQQELARPGVVERFFPNSAEDQADIDNMRSAFAGLYSLGEDATSEDLVAVQEAMNGKEGQYVLKPQREGGGYNFYGKNLADKLKENTTVKDGKVELGAKLGEYILMQRLFPPQQRAVLLRNGKVEGSGDSVSELGCYGTVVVTPDGDVVHNEYAGFLLRTKFSNIDEGGVASGFATLSSPHLC